MKNLFFICVISILISSCATKCPSGEPVFRNRKSEKLYNNMSKDLELNVKGAIKVLETVDIGNLDITTKKNITELRDNLDQYSGRTSDLLMTTIIRSNSTPCDVNLRDRVTQLMDVMQNQSTEVETLRLNVSKAIEDSTPLKESIIKSAVVEFKDNQEETDSKLDKIVPEKLQLNDQWVVAFSDNKTLNEAQNENEKLKKLNINDNIIVFRNKSYRLISKSFPLKSEVNVLLSKSRSQYDKDSYTINVKTWCPNMVNKGEYFICE